MTKEKIKTARALRTKGESPQSIADLLHVSKKAIYRYTANLSPVMHHPLYKTASIQHDFFSPANLKKHPHRLILVGFIAADGCISKRSKNSGTLIIRLSKKDSHVLQIFNDCLSKNTRTISESKRSKAIDFPSNQICQDLSAFGIVPRKTAIYNWPNLTRKQAQLFLLGYFYGDGCFHSYKNRNVIHFVCTFRFARKLRKFLYDLKIVDHCVLSRYKKRPNYAQLVFQGKHCNKLIKWLFRSLSKFTLLPRKHPPSISM